MNSSPATCASSAPGAPGVTAGSPKRTAERAGAPGVFPAAATEPLRLPFTPMGEHQIRAAAAERAPVWKLLDAELHVWDTATLERNIALFREAGMLE